MRRARLIVGFALVALAVLPAALARPASSENSGIAYSIELHATIDPATDQWINKALDEAKDKHAKLAIIRLDTPGGLDSSMRSIIKHIIGAPMPVVVYVSPNGSRAASAGLYITESADVAAMAPQTNIGSATPISIGPGGQSKVLGRKIENDAAAYVRALTEGHGRNADLAEQMVRKATNVTAETALKANLIDVVAPDETALLKQLDGFQIKGPKAQKLDTTGLAIVKRDMPFQYDLLELLVDPTISFLLLMIGLAGIALEFFHPGTIIPGALGALCLVLGLYGTLQLPITVTGVILLVLALVLFVAEAYTPTHGILGAAGVVSLIAAGLMLYDTGASSLEVSPPVLIVAALLLGGYVLLAGTKAMAARRRPKLTGTDELLGAEGLVRVPLDPVGQIMLKGALWRARPTGDGEPVQRGARVRVESVDGLTLFVSPVAGEQEREGAE